MKSSRFAILLTAVTLLDATSSYAEGDAGRGANLFDSNCGECHSLKPGRHKKGPSLAGVFGRKSASMSDYEYSDSLRAIGVQWTAENLDRYLSNPRGTYPGIKMKFDGLPDAKDRGDLIAFFSQH
jgi:cytochrome c